jgi:hypothetical protein
MTNRSLKKASKIVTETHIAWSLTGKRIVEGCELRRKGLGAAALRDHAEGSMVCWASGAFTERTR